MVTRDEAWRNGTPCWADLGVADIGKAGDFYTSLFGWQVQPGGPESGGYAMCLLRGRPVAGIGPKQGPPGTPSVWTTYLASDNVDATVEAIIAAGGQVLTGPMPVTDAGRMAVAADPGGAVFGVWQAGRHIGAGIANEPGSLCWNENYSRDIDRNKAFYRAVFGYEYGEIPDAGMRYATLKIDGTEVGGIGETDGSFPGMAPCWSVYFAVADTDTAVARLSQAGGGVDRPPWDTPYGRIAAVHDDQSAAFFLISRAGG